MQSKKKQENGKVANLFPEEKIADLFPADEVANLFPEEDPNLDQLYQTFGEQAPGVEIGLSTEGELDKPHWLSKLLGISQGIKDAESNPLYNELNSMAEEMETNKPGGILGVFADQAASDMRQTASGILMGSIGIRAIDFEERPRKILGNILALKSKQRVLKVRKPGELHMPITKADLKQAISDGLDGVEYKSPVKNIGGLIYPQGEIRAEEKMKRLLEHDPQRAQRLQNGEEFLNLCIAIGSEIVIAKGAGLVVKGVKVSVKAPSALFRKFIPKIKAGDAIDDIFFETTKAIAKDAGALDPVDGLIRAMAADPTNMDEAYRVYTTMTGVAEIPGAESIDDVYRGLVYKKWLQANIKTDLNPEGFLKPKELNNLIESAGLQSLEIPKRAKDILFHGSPTGKIDLISPYYHTQTWREGVGFYTTDSFEQAQKYALGRTAKGTRKTQASKEGAITYVRNLSKKELNMDASIDRSLWNEMTDRLELGKDYLKKYLEPYSGKLKTNEEAYSAIRVAYIDEIGEDGVYAINEALVDMGYGATKHIEGIKSGKPHTVRIFLSPDAVEIAEDFVFPQAIRRTLKVDELNVSQLEDIALEVQSIKNAPKKWRDGFVETLRRKTYGPPVNTYSQLGLERQFARNMDAVYMKNHVDNQDVMWVIDKKRQFKKKFKKKWEIDSPIDLAAGDLANGISIKNLPDDVTKFVTPEELDWLQEAMAEHKVLVFDPLRDEAIKQGKITYDPELIAAGVPPVEENYFHWMNQKVVDSIKLRYKIAEAEGKDIIYPPHWDIRGAIKGKPMTDVNIGEFFVREGTADDIVRSFTRVERIACGHETTKLFIEPAFKRMEEAIELLPADINNSMRRAAKDSFAAWSRQVRHMPHPVDKTMNVAFNKMSRKAEKILPKWEAQEQAFQNFAAFASKRIDQGLLLGNPRPVVRNLFQSGLNANLYGNMNTLWGYQQLLTPGGRHLLQTSQMYPYRGVPLAAFNITDRKSWRQLTYLGIHATDKYLNVGSSYLTGWKYYFQQNRRAWDELVEFGVRRGVKESSLRRGSKFADTLADAIDAGKFLDTRRMIDYRGVGLTQWMYDSASMSPLLRTTTGKLALKYTNWTQYMWGAHMPQLWDQMRTGKDIFGQAASPSVRYAYLQMMAKGGLLYMLGDTIGVSMEHIALTGSMPKGYAFGKQIGVPVSPSVGMVLGGLTTGTGLAVGLTRAFGTMSMGALYEDNRMLSAGWDQLCNSSLSHVPLYGQYRRYKQVKEGKVDPIGFLTPTPYKEKEVKKHFKL